LLFRREVSWGEDAEVVIGGGWRDDEVGRGMEMTMEMGGVIKVEELLELAQQSLVHHSRGHDTHYNY
jgi:hypothetical protein